MMDDTEHWLSLLIVICLGVSISWYYQYHSSQMTKYKFGVFVVALLVLKYLIEHALHRYRQPE